MELVFRQEKKCHDLYLEPRQNGSVGVTIRAKNGTGEYNTELSSNEFELLKTVRDMVMEKE